VNYWKLLEIILFIPPNTFWRVGKLYGFGKYFLRTLGDALRDWLCTFVEAGIILFSKKSSKNNYA